MPWGNRPDEPKREDGWSEGGMETLKALKINRSDEWSFEAARCLKEYQRSNREDVGELITAVVEKRAPELAFMAQVVFPIRKSLDDIVQMTFFYGYLVGLYQGEQRRQDMDNLEKLWGEDK